MPAWQYLWKSSRLTNRVDAPDSDREMNRSTSSKSDSSQGIASGPWLEKPYSSSASTRSFLKTGWFRYDARTTNRVQLLPTLTATCPAGTSDGMRLADMRALLRHRRSSWRSLTMWRILLHFPSPADMLLESDGKCELGRLYGCNSFTLFFLRSTAPPSLIQHNPLQASPNSPSSLLSPNVNSFPQIPTCYFP